MSFSNTNVKHLYQGNGSNADFPIPATIIVDDSSETLVYVYDYTDPDNITIELQVEGALQDYTLVGASPPTTPFDTTVRFNSAPTSTQKILVYRRLPLTQILDMIGNGAFFPESQELAFDRLVAMIQQLDEQSQRAPLLPITTQAGPLTLPDPVAGAIIRYNDAGDDLELLTMTELAEALQMNAFLIDHTEVLGNGSSTTSVTDMILDKTIYSHGKFDYCIERRTSTQGIRASGTIILEYEKQSATWLITDLNYTNGHGVTFAVNSSGQVSYTSDTMSGSSYVGNISWRLARRFALEA